MRKLAVVLLLACLAVGAWWTATPRTAQQAVGWCVERRGQEIKVIRCPAPPREKVVGVSPQYIDFVGEPPFGHHCPPETDEMVRSPVPGEPWLCLDNKPGDGNTRG